MSTSRATPEAVPTVEMAGITVDHGPLRALDGVDLTLRRGEIHALMGENGAGKSTLINTLAGVISPTSGSIRLDGRPLRFSSPADAQSAGIRAVLQDVPVAPHLSIGENVMLGHEPRGRFGIRWKELHFQAHRLLDELGLGEVDTRRALRSLSPATAQLVAIARAMADDPRVLLLDEPTSSLDRVEVEKLFLVLRRLRERGVAMVFASHFLEQVLAISDRLTVLRSGTKVAEFPARQVERSELISLMIGRDLTELRRIGSLRREHRADPAGPPFFSARQLGQREVLAPTDLDLHRGEVVGIAGLRGSGRTELARLLTGGAVADSGSCVIDGRAVSFRSPAAALRHHIAMASEDRLGEGVIAGLSVRENIVVALQSRRGWARPMSRAERDELVGSFIEELGISPSDPSTPIEQLSGGNQQKVMLARWLATRPRIIVLDEPTKGIDMRSRVEIQSLVARLAANRVAVVIISSDLEELLRLSDRIVVMKDRMKIGEVSNGPGLSVETIIEMIAAPDEDDELPPLIRGERP
ncbi:sugar ABC transporter ATP-binding protein [Brachybacterium paraconglomeratum]|uniref:sugar ABC transporter ATP-binding protein n=1 Tax=Brachybacterium paraconglomeratum TaxID=173362 RepID=UPI0031EE4BD4